jgi:hypothetical protein
MIIQFFGGVLYSVWFSVRVEDGVLQNIVDKN